MTPKEAAAIIGCSVSHVRSLSKSGKIKAKYLERTYGYYYDISQREAERYRDARQSKGFPRGAKRTKVRGPIQNNDQ